MLLLIIKAFYLALPAYFANMAPVIFAKLNWLKAYNKPVDCGRNLAGKRLFGSHKTWRGFISGAFFGLIIATLQAVLIRFDFFNKISIVDYGRLFLLFGLFSGVGAITGDLIKSFFKRRLGIKSGNLWLFFDQLDFIAGFFIFTFWLVDYDWQIIIAVFAITFVLHPLINIFSYLLGIKKVWW